MSHIKQMLNVFFIHIDSSMHLHFSKASKHNGFNLRCCLESKPQEASLSMNCILLFVWTWRGIFLYFQMSFTLDAQWSQLW